MVVKVNQNDESLKILNEQLEELRSQNLQTVPGELIFKLYDTFGFPLDLTRDVGAEQGFTVDEEGFEAALEAQRARARASCVCRLVLKTSKTSKVIWIAR